MDKFSYLQITNLYHHHYEEHIRSNIKWCSKEYISTPLIQLTAEFSICYIKLKQCMTRRRSSIWIFDKFDYFSNIPSIDNNSSAMRVVFNLTYYITNLISYKIISSCPWSPLFTIYCSEIHHFWANILSCLIWSTKSSSLATHSEEYLGYFDSCQICLK